MGNRSFNTARARNPIGIGGAFAAGAPLPIVGRVEVAVLPLLPPIGKGTFAAAELAKKRDAF